MCPKFKPNMTEEAKVDLLRTATKHNLPGVRVVAENLEAHLAHLAHYTGCKDTDELKQWWKSLLAGSEIMVAFRNPRNNNFGNMSQIRPRQDRFFQCAYSSHAPAMINLPIPLPTDPNKPTLRKAQRMDRAFWMIVVAMHQIITQNPTHFFTEPVNRSRRSPRLPDEQQGSRNPQKWP